VAKRLPSVTSEETLAQRIDLDLEGDLSMKMSKLLVAAILAVAIGAPIAGFAGT
jgi:hypothetical protein